MAAHARNPQGVQEKPIEFVLGSSYESLCDVTSDAKQSTQTTIMDNGQQTIGSDFPYDGEFQDDDYNTKEGQDDSELKDFYFPTESGPSVPAQVPPSTPELPVPIDHFLRNFLRQMDMKKTLCCFQSEWTEKVRKEQLDTEKVDTVPDVYIQNMCLDSELKNALREREEYRRAASQTAEDLKRAQKSRDMHRINHKRVVQEKDLLIKDMRKLKAECDRCEATLKQTTEKYQALLKQTGRLALERDKVLEKVKRQAARHRTATSHIPSYDAEGATQSGPSTAISTTARIQIRAQFPKPLDS